MRVANTLKSYTNWVIERANKLQHAVAPNMPVVTVLDGGQLKTRNALKVGVFSPKYNGKFNMLVAELEGVKVYVQKGSIIVTKKELDL